MLTKYASFEVSAILDIKGSPTRARQASLDKLSDFDDYRTEDGFLYARIRAISSRVNKNHDGWPSVELAGGPEAWERYTSTNKTGFTVNADRGVQYGYSTFLGKPIFIDHHNTDPTRARGVIVDSKLHVEDHRTAGELDPYYTSAPDNHMPPTWVELLLEVDAKSFPKFAKAIIIGSRDPSKGINGFSMGCDVERSECNICKNSATIPDEYCLHIRMKGAHFDFVDEHGHKISKRAYEDCYGIKFFEISGVFDPADETALTRELISSVHKEGSPQSINLEPNWEGVRQWLLNMARSDLVGAIRVNLEMGSEAIDSATLAQAARVTPEEVETLTGELGQLGQMDTTEHPLGPHSGAVTNEHDPQGLDSQLYPDPDAVMAEAQTLMARGVQENAAMQIASMKLKNQMRGQAIPAHGEGERYEPKMQDFTDLPKEIDWEPRNNPMLSKTADNPLPQGDLLHAPQDVDTLREEKICPVCGSSMDEESCEICGYVEPPENFNNPDLQKAQQQGPDQPQGPTMDIKLEGLLPETGPQATNPPPAPDLNSDMSWQASVPSRVAARINQVERPILPGGNPATDEPRETIISDQDKPTTSRTAREYIVAARRKANMNPKTADAASGAPAVATPDTRTEVDGVGGVQDASNEQASKADAQINVEGVGGTGVEGVGAEQENVSVAQGNEHSKNIESIPTKTFPDTGQRDPITSEPWPAAEDGVKKSYDSGPFPAEDGGLGGGTAVQGVDPADPYFKADDRVNLLDSVTSPENNSGETKTWSGTDGNGVLRQQEPVTTEPSPDTTRGASIHSTLELFKLADLEVELGLLDADKKYDRIAELETEHPEHVKASLQYARRVKTAGLQKRTMKEARRVPSMQNAPAPQEKTASTDDLSLDSALFT